jgi:uncharacterized membrane protein YidH (DUF202 family)
VSAVLGRGSRAAERTFLAWLRTDSRWGIRFGGARFGLLLQPVEVTQPKRSIQSSGLSQCIGIAITGGGTVAGFLSAGHSLRWTGR